MSATSVARAFWLLGIDQPLIASANLLDAIATIRLFFPSEVAQADDALELSLNRRGLATDLASLTEQFDFLKRESLEFWGGSHLLHTRSGELLYLQASNDMLPLEASSKGCCDFDLENVSLAKSVNWLQASLERKRDMKKRCSVGAPERFESVEKIDPYANLLTIYQDCR